MIINLKDIYLAAAGGLIIGIATSIHYLLKGRVTGFSGIFYSLITFDKNSFYWKLSLMSSVVLSSSILYRYFGVTPLIDGASPSFDSIQNISKIGYLGAAVAGFLVGFGTKLGNGCTSGHGVCGLPRLSERSMVAVAAFMTTGLLTATLKNAVIVEEPTNLLVQNTDLINTASIIISGLLTAVGIIGQTIKGSSIDAIISSIVGFIFGTGLVVSGMAKRTKILGFLTLDKNWDPSLMFVMMGAVCFNLITFNLLKKPLLSEKYDIPTNRKIDFKLVLGASIFGIGWGIGGLCPGPAFALFPQFTAQVGGVFLGALAVGQFNGNKFSGYLDSKLKCTIFQLYQPIEIYIIISQLQSLMNCFLAESELQTLSNSKLYPSELNSPNSERKPSILKRRWNSDDLAKYCPIDVPNAFQYDKINGEKFKLFLEGKYSPNKLVKDMNVVVKRRRLTHLEQQFYRQKEEQQLKKDLVEKRFSKVRLLINQNIKLREVRFIIFQSLKLENNLKGSRMFSQLNNHIVDYISKIKSKDLLTDRIDGNRLYEPKKLYDFNKSGIKLKFNKKERQIQSEDQYCTKQIATLEVQDHVEQYFKQQQEVKLQQEIRQKRKAKLKIISDRKHRKYFTEFDANSLNKKAPPSLKDVQLFKYIHGQMLMEKYRQKQEEQKSALNNHSQNKKCFHALSNFEKPSELFAFDDCDQSFESMKEMKLSSLYAESIELQHKMLTERRLVNQVSQSKQLDHTANLIQIVNRQKLK